ncbi:MAG: hypothetical protein J6W00_11010 [Lentisphaeria bacterium]|nr:hypothetical protein [Lentisphaeria bacterium]
MLNFNDIHQRAVINCELLPLDDITSALQSFAAVRKVDLIATAILLAQSQKTLGKKDWLAWAEEVSGLTRSECYHRAKVGHFMIACYDKKVLYKNLLKLSGDKLLALSRLPLETIEGFLSVTPVASMPIDQVRNAVSCQLCHLDPERASDCEHCLLNSGKQRQQAELPGFSAALDAIWEMDADGFIAGVTDDTQAVKCASGGCNLLSAYLEHEKSKLRKNPDSAADTVSLLQVKAALLDSIKDIENILAGVIDEENNEDLETELAASEQECSCHTEKCANLPAISGQPDLQSFSNGGSDHCCSHAEDCANRHELCSCHTECTNFAGECSADQQQITDPAGECSCRSTGAAEVPAIYSTAKDDGAQDSGSDNCR